MIVEATLSRLVERLLAARGPAGSRHWTGELSSSALSTATASITLMLEDPASDLARQGLGWLERTQNPDGGWGDTDRSKSNISTTALCLAGFTIAKRPNDRCETWLRAAAGGSLDPQPLATAIAIRYGKDQTFSVPILTVLAIAGRVPWSIVPQLPFELAAFPQAWYRWLGLPVVSYALPALIAIGHVHHRLAPTRNPITRLARAATAAVTLKVLEDIQPSNGGFLEATPLTSFVCLSLLAAGYSRDGAVIRRGLQFLKQSARSDGSWPIDTNLATWTTTLAVNALTVDRIPPADRGALRDWLLGQQYRVIHPYTGAPPGAWAWTDLPGGVPDADDTSGALIALRSLDPAAVDAARAGIRWLLDLQNSDGGIPTFCKGWGKLPFDRSSQDITAHALLAWSAWKPSLPPEEAAHVERATARALRFLEEAQRRDGAFVPLWFGNQDAANDENPTYGTARVVIALEAVAPKHKMTAKAVRWLQRAQNADGGWGGDRGCASTIEETSLAVSALAAFDRRACARGAKWLAQSTESGETTPAYPLGFYFARLWYYEQLYPLIFATDALRRVVSYFERSGGDGAGPE